MADDILRFIKQTENHGMVTREFASPDGVVFITVAPAAEMVSVVLNSAFNEHKKVRTLTLAEYEAHCKLVDGKLKPKRSLLKEFF